MRLTYALQLTLKVDPFCAQIHWKIMCKVDMRITWHMVGPHLDGIPAVLVDVVSLLI